MKKPAPDSNYFIDYLLGKSTGKPPLVEYLVDDVVMRPIQKNVLHREWCDFTQDIESKVKYLDNFIQFWYKLGYDFVRFEQNAGFPTLQVGLPDTAKNSPKTRMWVEQHKSLISSWQDFESYPFPDVDQFDFSAYEYLSEHLPDGMGLIVSHAAGVFEHLSQIMSYEGLCLALYDQPSLVEALAYEIGSRIEKFYLQLLDLDNIIALFPGDDMGFRTGTLVAPEHLRKFVLPWHKKFSQMAHERNIPYFLHSCGNLSAIMEDLIEDVKIDGKHSFEDSIIPVEKFHQSYSSRIASLGGVDINILANGTVDEVRRKVHSLMDNCGSSGRYAIGSGNSIPSYIPLENYLAMVDEAKA